MIKQHKGLCCKIILVDTKFMFTTAIKKRVMKEKQFERERDLLMKKKQFGFFTNQEPDPNWKWLTDPSKMANVS